MTKPLLITDAIDENLKLVRDADGTDTSIQLSKDKLKVTGDLNVTGDVKTPNQSTPVSDFDLATKKYVDDNAGGSTVQYYYETKITNYYASSTAIYIPLAGYVLERTSTSGSNEFLGFIAPYNGVLEKALWRSEVPHDGTLTFEILEAADGTEIPSTSLGSKATVIDIADDTTQDISFSSMSAGSNALTKGRVYIVKITSPSASQDTNVTTVWKWDITT
jgi:hypothetical protein